MRAWRICAEKHMLDLTGYGASLHGGRWNSRDVRVLYTGTTPEICSLEMLVHANGMLPLNFMLCELELPDDAALYSSPALEAFPQQWNALPADQSSAAYGDEFILSGEYLGLFVPSVIVPESNNLLVNPQHPAMRDVRMVSSRPFTFDPRIPLKSAE